MFPINFDTCTIFDVLRRSFECHPSLFRDQMLYAAQTHRDYSYTTQDKIAERTASSAAKDCNTVAEAIDCFVEGHDFARFICEDQSSIGCMIQAFTVAARLQVLPHHVAQAIAGRKPVSTMEKA